MSNQQSFMNAIKWAYSANWGEKAFSSLFTFLLAAMLGPRDFGIVSIAMIYIAFIQMLLNQGLLAALIQRPAIEPEHLDSVFWANCGLGVVLTGLSVLFGGWWARLNHVPELASYIAVLSICIPIQGMTIVQTALLQRDLDFKTLSIRSNASVFMGGVVGIVMAWGGYGVWSLVGQQIIRDIIGLVLLWKLTLWRPRRRFSWKHLRQLILFSISNFVAQLGIFFDGQSGAILMGTLFGPVAVGLYRLAERVVNSVSAVATSSIQTVSLPEFSRLQNEPHELRRSVLTCVRMSAVVTLPSMAGLVAVSDPLMATLGSNWSPAANVLRILSVLGMFLMFSIFTGPLLQALSRPHYLAIMEWARTITGIILLLMAAWLVKGQTIQWQITGIALARCATGALLVTPVFLFLLLRLTGVSIHAVLTAIIPSAMSAAAVWVSVLLVQLGHVFGGSKPAAALITQVAIGGAIGLTTLLSLDGQLRLSVIGVAQRRFGIATRNMG